MLIKKGVVTMKGEHENLLTNERGVTLVELLASIVIVTIILISVISIFNLTMKSNRTSEEIIDATYVAQTEIEKIYALSKKDISNPKLTDIGYEKIAGESDWDIFKEATPQYEGFFVQVKQKEQAETGLMRIVVNVYEDSAFTKSQAQMEHLLEWGADHAETP